MSEIETTDLNRADNFAFSLKYTLMFVFIMSRNVHYFNISFLVCNLSLMTFFLVSKYNFFYLYLYLLSTIADLHYEFGTVRWPRFHYDTASYNPDHILLSEYYVEYKNYFLGLPPDFIRWITLFSKPVFLFKIP